MVTKKRVVDQMGRTIEVPDKPQRIVSLVPSQTELLYELGLNEEVVGQTLFCIHPEEMHRSKPKVGGTKNFSFEKIKTLSPDLIIGNKEENEQQRIEELEQYFPVWMSDILSLTDALQMITDVGALVGKPQKAIFLSNAIRQSFDELKPIQRPLQTAYLIWRNPWMAAGHNTFINDMLTRIGLQNVFSNMPLRYPEISTEILQELKPELILLSSEPYPFKGKHIEELKRLLPAAQILLVDGELFSWYGNRLLHSATYFKQLLADII